MKAVVMVGVVWFAATAAAAAAADSKTLQSVIKRLESTPRSWRASSSIINEPVDKSVRTSTMTRAGTVDRTSQQPY